MDQVSVFTVLLLTALNLGTVSVALPLIMGRGVSRAARLAQASLIAQTLGWVAIIASGFWAGHWLDMAISTVSMACAGASNYLMFLALRAWLGRRVGEKLLIALVILMPLGYALSFSNYSVRVGWANFLLAAQLLLLARATIRHKVDSSRRWRWMLFLCYGAVAGATIGRGILGAFFPESYPHFQSGHPVNMVAQIVANVGQILITVAILVAWREEAEAKLRAQAFTDHLTGLPNRHGWDERARVLFDQAQRHDSPLALIMLDLDHFKRINDTHGHEAGDQVLRMVGRVLQSNRRSSDLAARLGGEEFALLLPQTDMTAAVLFEHRLREAFLQAGQEFPQGAVNYSAGLAMLRPSDHSLTELIIRADNGLYQAKALGRGRLELTS
ncbi:MAG TPA: GGDEF domain-containing protein [Rhodoferax sp.]|nr:GGDEF domain-containing protein [Rhodoferax sp.]